jgi:hypothetical protein
MNQRGQAFSVFELMISAVVAFAILVVLLQIIGVICIWGDNCGGALAKDSLSNALKRSTPSGDILAQNFALEKGQIVTVSDVVSGASSDADSLFFLKGQLGENQLVEINSSVQGEAYIKNNGNKLVVSARILCKMTAEELDTVLGLLGNTFDLSASTAQNYCGDNQPCCAAVLLKRQP